MVWEGEQLLWQKTLWPLHQGSRPSCHLPGLSNPQPRFYAQTPSLPGSQEGRTHRLPLMLAALFPAPSPELATWGLHTQAYRVSAWGGGPRVPVSALCPLLCLDWRGGRWLIGRCWHWGILEEGPPRPGSWGQEREGQDGWGGLGPREADLCYLVGLPPGWVM